MRVLFKNASVLCMKNDHYVVCKNQMVSVCDHIICKVMDSREDLEDLNTYDRIIDCNGNLLMPGFKNAHTHSAMTFLRSKADEAPLNRWLNQVVFPAEAKLTEDDIYHLTKLAILEYIEGGITSAFEMYLTPDSIAQAATDCKFRMTLTAGLNNFSQSVKEVIRWDETLNKMNDLIRFVPGFHAEYTCSKVLLEELSEYTKSQKRPVYAHISETQSEVSGCMERYNQTPPELFESLGLFDYGGGGYHCVHFMEQDYEIFKNHGLFAVTNPASNLKLSSGIAPISKFLEKEIPVAIGTDGPASNNSLDFFKEMFLVSGLCKYLDNNPCSGAANDILTMACANGAFAMGLKNATSVSEGMLADLILIDLNKPNMHPLGNEIKNLIYSANKSNVIMTMIHGEIVYENGTFYIGEDVETIYEKAERITKRILSE